MDELIDIPIQELEPAYKKTENVVKADVSFNIDYYRSHLVPVRETIELKKAIAHE